MTFAQSHTRAALARLALALGLVAAGSSCKPDLGACDLPAAEELVYGRGDLVATKGQALMHDSCGNAAFCHSKNAKGSNRHGAPSGLDFDMLPLPTGWPAVEDHDSAIWSAVHGNSMPPGGIGAKVQGDGDWLFDPARAPGSRKLPLVVTSAGKAIVRNWLACGAPVVDKTHVPPWAVPGNGGGAGTGTVDGDGGAGTDVLADWAGIYTTVIGPSCALAGCHGTTGAGGLVMTDACSAYKSLKTAGDCSRPRVVPGDVSSPLLDKLSSDTPSCGVLRMPPPPLSPLPTDVIANIRAWVQHGAPAAHCK
jgi:hypothetical protein